MQFRFALAMVVATSLLAPLTSFAGDEQLSAVTNTAVVKNIPQEGLLPAKAPDPTAAAKYSAHPDVAIIVYYSKKAEKGPMATADSRLRLKIALFGIRGAKLPPEEGGLGLAPTTGFRAVEEHWDDFVLHTTCPPTPDLPNETAEQRTAKAQLDAEALRPFLYRGGTVFVLTDPNDAKWCATVGPLSCFLPPIAQFDLAIKEHKRLIAASSSATKVGSTPAASAPPAALVRTVSTGTNSEQQR